MDGINDIERSDDWFSDNESEAQNLSLATCSSLANPNKTFCAGHGEASTSASPHSMAIYQFVGMGFSKSMVVKAIEENGEGNTEAILETLLTYSTLGKSPTKCESDLQFSESDNESFDFFSDGDSCLRNEEDVEYPSDKKKKLLHLVDMGFPADEASSAIDACGPDTSIIELMDFISAAQMAKAPETRLQEQPCPSNGNQLHLNHKALPTPKKRKQLFEAEDRWKRKQDSWREKESQKKKIFVSEDEERINIPKLMIGFGVPKQPKPGFSRTLPDVAIGPPFFYYENVALTPKGVWSTISRFLHDIEPEFVDSLHFCAAARKRGYVHNLPIDGRYPLQQNTPLTIQEAFPELKKWWPTWDCRTKFNCLNTCYASAKLTERVKDALESWNGHPPLKTQKYVLYECRKWNLVWTGKNKAAPLEAYELEMLMGYPKNHTRGASKLERHKALGNSFQVDTVAYHFSVLKKMFSNGITVLSLFSGIGGAEVALHNLGIPLKNVVSVEASKVCRSILRGWWEQTNQTGNLIEIEDVQDLTADKLESLVRSLGGFDFIVGGSPCNNLTGSNRHHRDGLGGIHSVLFYDYFRILGTVKSIMENN